MKNLLHHKKALQALQTHERILLAVSGGSDSLALLFLLHDKISHGIFVATVDHKLRAESKTEAEMVAKICQQLNLPHEILSREILSKQSINNSAQDARNYRYELLAAHANKISATAIITAHTQDDQAETILMRAKRLESKSHTGGLAAIAYSTTYKNVKLIRPLLKTSRKDLQNYLTQKNIRWVDDPNNENIKYERARLRKTLAKIKTPTTKDLAKFATLCGTSRLWLNKQTVTILPQYVESNGSELLFSPPATLPTFVIAEVLALLVRLVSGSPYRLAQEKLTDSILAIRNRTTSTKTAGHTIIKVKNGTARVSPETRRVVPNSVSPNVSGLEHFRPLYDDCLYEWAADLC